MVGDRKLAGILAEVVGPHTFVVMGIGLNVTLGAEEAGDPVAALLSTPGLPRRRDCLIRRLLSELGARINDWRMASGLDDKLISDCRARSVTVGSEVRVSCKSLGENTLSR
jgi:BirA family biotin operon repressor/biotin-[acetyl-CoA-carboxylase] ligase